MTDIYTKNKSAALYTVNSIPKVREICQPLTDYLGIDSFGYIRMHTNCSFVSLINGYKDYILKHHEIVKTQDPQFTSTMRKVPVGEPYFYLWPTSINNLPPILSLLYEHNIWNGFSIYFRQKDYIECFAFSTERNSENKSDFYINNTQLLIKFCNYFREKATELLDTKDKNKLALYPDKFDISLITNENDLKKTEFVNFINNQQLPRLMGRNGKMIKLTKRELDCAKIFMQNRTSKEIASILNLSPRTIEHYIDNIKHKFEVNYKGELVDILSQNKIL